MSRHSRLIAVLAPGLAFSNVAFALTVNVGATVTTPCDSTNTAQTVCDETTVSKAIAAVNAAGDPANTIDINELAYAPAGGAEANTPVIQYPTTIRSDAADPAALPWRLRTIRGTADLTLQNLAIKSGDVSGPFGSGEPALQRFAAVDVLNGNVTGTNIATERGFHSSSASNAPGRPNNVQSVYVREGDVTLTGMTSASGAEGYPGGVFLQDDYDAGTSHDLVIADSSFTDNGAHGLWGPSGVVTGYYVDSATISNTTFTRTREYAIEVTGASLTVTDAVYDSTGFSFGLTGGVRFRAWGDETELRISDSSFTGAAFPNYGAYDHGAIRVDGNGSTRALIEHSAFQNNNSRVGAADINWYGYGNDTLEVVDTTFEGFAGTYGGSVYVNGGTTRFVDSSWDGTNPSGGEGYNANSQGGAIYQDGETDLWVERSSFSNTSANSSGGAVYVYGGEGSRSRFVDTTFSQTRATSSGGAVSAGEGDYSFVRTSFNETEAWIEGGGVELRHPYSGQAHTTFIDSAFTDTRALYLGGGGVSARGSQYVEMSGVTFTRSSTGALASEEPLPTTSGIGFIAYGGEGGGAIRLQGQDDYYRGDTFGASYLYGGESGVTLIADHLDVVGASALYGGVFYASGAGNTLIVSDSSFTDSQATIPEFQGPVEPAGVPGIGGPQGIPGLGGVAYSDPGNIIEFHSSNMFGLTAFLGGALFSGSLDPEYPNDELAGGGPSGCFYLQDDKHYYGPEYGTEWVIDGVAFDDGAAELAASVAWFGRHDNVTMTGSTITGNLTEGRATIVANNASRIDLSCNTFCDNEVGSGGSGLEIYDDAMFPEFEDYYDGYGGEQKEVRYELRNNVFQDGVSGEEGYAVLVQTCPSVWDYGYNAVAAPSYGGEGTRGHVKVLNNTFVGNTGTNFVAQTTDVRLDVRNNLFQDGEVGWLIGYDANYVEGGYNLYGDTTEDVVDLPGFGFDVLDATNQTSPAVFRSYTPGTCGAELYLEPTSPGIDDADPDAIWNDNWPNDPLLPDVPNVGDIGAFGGPGACVPDADGDHQNAIVDCDDETQTTYVDAIEIPYDGIDQDCDGDDLCDIDADGSLADFALCGGDDCNDLAPGIHPGATDIIDNGIDEDCSGSDALTDEDVDNDGHPDEQYGGHDCDDSDATINPSADEVAYDGIDQDCEDGDLVDVDCDGHAALASEFPNDVCPEGVICDDCDDGDATINPEAHDDPTDDIDQDCVGGPAELWAQGGLGCGCATPGAPTPVGGAVGLFAAALAFVRRRGKR